MLTSECARGCNVLLRVEQPNSELMEPVLERIDAGWVRLQRYLRTCCWERWASISQLVLGTAMFCGPTEALATVRSQNTSPMSPLYSCMSIRRTTGVCARWSNRVIATSGSALGHIAALRRLMLKWEAAVRALRVVHLVCSAVPELSNLILCPCRVSPWLQISGFSPPARARASKANQDRKLQSCMTSRMINSTLGFRVCRLDVIINKRLRILTRLMKSCEDPSLDCRPQGLEDTH